MVRDKKRDPVKSPSCQSNSTKLGLANRLEVTSFSSDSNPDLQSNSPDSGYIVPKSLSPAKLLQGSRVEVCLTTKSANPDTWPIPRTGPGPIQDHWCLHQRGYPVLDVDQGRAVRISR